MAYMLVDIGHAGQGEDGLFRKGDRISVAPAHCLPNSSDFFAWDWKFGFYREIVLRRSQFETDEEYEHRHSSMGDLV